MKITIDDETLEKHGLSFQKFLYLYLIYKNFDFDSTKQELLSKDFITQDLFGNIFCINTPQVKELIGAIRQTQSSINPTEEEVALAEKLMEIFPKGMQQGKYPWRGSKMEISQKIHTLKNRYNQQFTDEEAIEATKKYVEKYLGDPYMQVLKYFLLKVNRTTGEMQSMFMGIIDNKGNIDDTDDSWQTHLV